MTTGRQTSAHIWDASIFDSMVEPESHIQGISMSSIASTSTRRGRGRSKNISLTRHIKDTGQKLRIEIPEGLSRPVGKYAKQFKTEVRGLGHGVVAPPSSSTGLDNNQQVEELTNRVTTTERQAQELTQQLQRMEAQMEAQRQQMEAQRQVQMACQKQQMEAQMDDMRSWQKNMEAMMQSIMTQKRATPPW
ncbi:hypothetical protein MRB53_005593 [Persea americana]|uniref:Uncharacterized protein n=1 Tax=Persea americana TaxID=3435 RepID=A0ACC2MDZ7_PERAE|nr:hypothetical protein MRB53_005593 [Persea americana]